MSAIPVIKRAAAAVHSRLASGPQSISMGYISTMSLLARNVLPKSVSRRLRNSICACSWPDLSFTAKPVILGVRTRVAIIPHIGEPDGDALFTRRLDYEAPVFAWLEQNAGQLYDLVVEIGANAGLYSVFFHALGIKKIIAFEPSAEAYRRSAANLAANNATSVQAINAAVGLESGTRAFFEPAGHLTNGSFHRDFAGYFSDRVVETTVAVVGPDELRTHLEQSSKALIKIDTEGAEAEIVCALAPLLRKHRPDVLIEVLPETAQALENGGALDGYSRALITAAGLIDQPSFFDGCHARDWLLRPEMIATGS